MLHTKPWNDSAAQPPIIWDRSWLSEMENRIEHNSPWDDWQLYQLAYQAEKALLIPHFDDLICLDYIPMVQPLHHQIETARKVMHEMRGRAILADEVGLGKTIEAGLILKEYLIRGLIRKVLILVPASLVLQWVRELNQKFGIPAVAHKKHYMWETNDIIVASMDTAKREPNRQAILNLEYDMLVIDEAHKLKNRQTANYQFVNQLRRKYCLLLTATPVQNDLSELYNLINILKPGQLGHQNDYETSYVAERRIPKNEGLLRQELNKVMIRNRRGDGGIAFTKRYVRNVPLTLSAEEQQLYVAVTDFIKHRYTEASGDVSSMLALITLQREVCSSRDAVFITLIKLFKKTTENSPQRQQIWELVEKIKAIKTNTKAAKTLDLIREINDKVIVFTEYRATQEYLLKFFKEQQMIAVPYCGGMNRGKKDWMMNLFRKRAQILVATEAGGEGINLQFCHHMINFDLPWNPMRIEQRIGRVHRLGQMQDVFIYNLSTSATIEEHIVTLLHEKINMFEQVIGGLDVILEKLEQQSPLEMQLSQVILAAKSDEEINLKLTEWGKAFEKLKTEVNEPTEEKMEAMKL